MAEGRIELVRAIIPAEGSDLVELFGEGGGPISAGGLVTDDATITFTSRSAEASREGPEGFREGWTDWLEPWASYRIYHDDFVERGDCVVALVTLRGVTKRDRVEIEHEAAAVFRFDGDQVVEIEFNLEREDALKR